MEGLVKRYINSSWILILIVVLGWTSAVWAELPSDFEQVWPPAPQTALERVAVSPDGLVLAGGDGPGVLLSRDRGVSWQQIDLPVVGKLRGLSWGDGDFLAVTSTGDVLRSETGEQWELEARICCRIGHWITIYRVPVVISQVRRCLSQVIR